MGLYGIGGIREMGGIGIEGAGIIEDSLLYSEGTLYMKSIWEEIEEGGSFTGRVVTGRVVVLEGGASAVLAVVTGASVVLRLV